METHPWSRPTFDALEEAFRAAMDSGNAEVTPMHLLAVLVDDGGTTVPAILEFAGAEPSRLARRLQGQLAKLPRCSWRTHPQVGRDLHEALEAADVERAKLGDQQLCVDHLLLAMSDILEVDRDRLLLAIGALRAGRASGAPRSARRRTGMMVRRPYRAATAGSRPCRHRRSRIPRRRGNPTLGQSADVTPVDAHSLQRR